MSQKDLLYYEDYDLDSYDDFEYSYDDRELSSSYVLSDTFNCGKTVLQQISQQIFYLLAINFVYRLIRQTGLLAVTNVTWYTCIHKNLYYWV